MPPNAADPLLVERLVIANRILYQHEIVDGFGHVSVRHDQSPQRFLLSRSLAPARVRREDIMSFDLEGNALDADSRAPYLERFIHSAIYRSRPDVQAIVHSHSPSVIPFASTRQPLRPLYHMSAFLGTGSALFEIREAGGNTDMLIRNQQLGAALATSLGERSVVLMRGHGSTVVGTSLEQAVFRAIYTEMNARLQAQAHSLGEPVFLNEEEAEAAARTNDGQIRRAWDLWQDAIGQIN